MAWIQGIQEGKIADTQEILLNLLKLKFGAAVTDEDISLIRRTNNLDNLRAALEVLISAKEKEEVLEKLQ